MVVALVTSATTEIGLFLAHTLILSIEFGTSTGGVVE